jgi:hypothetical protein
MGINALSSVWIYEGGGCIPEEVLWDYISGKLSAQVSQAVNQHLKKCPSCRVKAQEVREDFEGFASAKGIPAGSVLRCWELIFGDGFLLGDRLPALKQDLLKMIGREGETVWIASDNGISNIIVGVLDDEGKVGGFALFRFLLYPVISDHKISMALRERRESREYDGYMAHIIVRFNGLPWEIPAKVNSSEIVIEDVPLPESFPDDIEGMELDIFIEPPRDPII